MSTTLIRSAAALALAAACLHAQAANVTLTGWAFGSGNTVNSTMYQGAAGGFVGSLDGAGAFDATPFTTYCVELAESFSFGPDAMTGYGLVGGAAYFGAAKSSLLGKLMTYVANVPTAVDSAAESTSLQLAIWNVVYDTDTSLTTAGVFRDTSAYASYANALLAGALTVSDSKYDVYALRKAGSQDFLLTKERDGARGPGALPEPATAALVAVALGGLGWSRRRRGV